MEQTLQFTPSLGIGLLFGGLNWLLWARWGKALLEGSTLNWGLFFARSFLKLGLLGGTIWFLLTRHIVEPVGFLAGFTLTVILLIIKGLK